MDSFGFDTRLDSRAFAQAKFAQFITEPGLIVRPAEAPPNRVAFWKASGVREETGTDGKPTMVVWGPPVEGERLDTLLNNEDQPRDKVLTAISLWIQAVLALTENTPPGGGLPENGGHPMEGGHSMEGISLWPCAAIIAQGDEDHSPSVFFAPPALIRRSVTHNDECYVNPALGGTASNGGTAAAFTAAAMLYRLFTGTPPFSAADISTLHQDMRDGNFLPPRLAVPGLDSRLAVLMQSALERPTLVPAVNETVPAADGGLGEMLKIIQTGGQTAVAASLVHPLADTDRLLLEKEKAQFLKIKTVSIKTRRFVARNTALLLGAFAAAAAAVLITYSVISSRALLPTTAGMEPVQVIESYYRSFGELDHQMMEACVTGGAGKNDIAAVINLFVITKSRQAYEHSTQPIVFPAHEWQGDDLDIPLFGAAELRVKWLEGDESGGKIRYRVDYTFWIPAQAAGETEPAADAISQSSPHSDLLTLVRDKKGSWHIAEITR